MNRFLYGRLKERSKDYRFYIPPHKQVGILFGTLSSDFLSSERKLLFLQRFEETITFGVRERLDLRDAGGRSITNFMGYQLESGESAEAVPFFNAFSSSFDTILKEAHECHRLLDEDSERGKSMQETQIIFARGYPQDGNGWDEAVTQIADSPSRNVLMMFDDTGKRLPMDVGYAQTKKPAPEQTARKSPPPRQHHDTQRAGGSHKSERPVSKQSPAPVSEEYKKSAHGLGITSSVTLNSDERRTIPPLHDYTRGKTLFEKVRDKFRTSCLFKHRKHEDNDIPPGPRNDM